MIDLISLWIGRIILLLLSIIIILGLIAIIVGLISYMFNKLSTYNVLFKALVFDIVAQRKSISEKNKAKTDIRVGRKWDVKHKGKWITWEIVKIK